MASERRRSAKRAVAAFGWLLGSGRRGLPEGSVLLCSEAGIEGAQLGVEALGRLADALQPPFAVCVREPLPDMTVSAFMRQCEAVEPRALRAVLGEVPSDGYRDFVRLERADANLADELRRLALLTASMRRVHARTREELLQRVDREGDLRDERRDLIRYLRAAHHGADGEREWALEGVLEYLGRRDDVQLHPEPVPCPLHHMVKEAAERAGVGLDNQIGRGNEVVVDFDLFHDGLEAGLTGLVEVAREFGINPPLHAKAHWRDGLVIDVPDLQVPLSHIDTFVRPFRLRIDGGPAGMQLAFADYLAANAEIEFELQPGPRGFGVRLFWGVPAAGAV